MSYKVRGPPRVVGQECAWVFMAGFTKPGATSTEHTPIVATVLWQHLQWTPDSEVMSLKQQTSGLQIFHSSTEGPRPVSRPPAAIPFPGWLNQSLAYRGAAELKSHTRQRAVPESHTARWAEWRPREQTLEPDYIYFYLTDSGIFKKLLHAKHYYKCSSNINSLLSHNLFRHRYY